MKAPNERVGGAVLLGIAAVYLASSLLLKRSAAAEPPTEAPTKDQALDVWGTATLLVKQTRAAALVDVRPSSEVARYPIAGAKALPGVNAKAVLDATAGAHEVIVVAENDKDSAALVSELTKAGRSGHYLKDGARAWYLAMELPVSLFSEKPPPLGYDDAKSSVRRWFVDGDHKDPERVLRAIGTIVKSGYEPSLLQGKKKASGGGGGKKKISGGCGG